MTASTGLGARGSHGYSLVELLVVMTIVAIVIGIAVPSYRYVTNSSRVTAEVNQLLGDMQYARSEAVKEGSAVSVCPSSNATTSSSPSCLGSTTWNSGWMVFSDLNGNGSFDTGDQLLRSQPALNSNDTFVASDSAVTYVSFNREGFTSIPSSDNTSAAGGLVFKLNVTPGNAQWERCLVISYVGVMQTLHGTTTAGQSCSYP
jgi:type IV fimbrial biogenesis protein FimT